MDKPLDGYAPSVYPVLMYFADHIREIRIAAGLNQTEFAQSLDVDQQTVSRWERGISLASLLILPTIAEAYEVDQVELQESLEESLRAREMQQRPVQDEVAGLMEEMAAMRKVLARQDRALKELRGMLEQGNARKPRSA